MLRVVWAALMMAAVAATGRAAAEIVVARDGSGDFTTVQAAVNSLPVDGGSIGIRPGRYEEKVTIAGAHVHLRGLGAGPSEVVISFNLSHGTAGGTWQSASVTVTGDDFSAENLTFENSFSRNRPLREGSQAVALRVTGTAPSSARCGFSAIRTPCMPPARDA